MCVAKLDDWEKTCPQTSQLCGFSPVWVRTCLAKLDVSAKPFPAHDKTKDPSSQTSQLYGFSPVWVRMCLVRCAWRAKFLPHSEHLKPGIEEPLLLTLMSEC